MTCIRDLLRDAGRRLNNRLEAELLLAHCLGRQRAWLYAHAEDLVEDAQREHFERLISAREDGQPVAYLTGRREFYGVDYRASNAVLIPRPETELLVDLALARLPEDHCRMVDVGTGSGCIGLSLARLRPAWHVSLCDISADALAVCQANAKTLSLDQVRIARSDLLDAFAGERFHAIISNPPYVARQDPHLSQGDLRFEPPIALGADDGGMAIIRRLIARAPGCLLAQGYLMLEHGHDQADVVARCLEDAGFENIETHRDLAGIDRVTLGRWRQQPSQHEGRS